MEVAELLIRKMKGFDVDINDWIEYIPDRPFNDNRYYISNEKLKSLGWKVKINFQTGIDELLRDMKLLA